LQHMPDEYKHHPSSFLRMSLPSSYSPDFTLSHYHPLMSMKGHMIGRHYKNDMAVNSGLYSFGRNVWNITGVW
jgi:hypothetical protein